MNNENFVIGVDFGTDSVRSVIVNAENGNIISTSVFYYPRWKQGLYCIPSQNQFRQHPLDYIEGIETTIKECLSIAPARTAKQIKGISIDTTGSTPCAVDKNGTPLSLLPEFKENPNAMFILWKDHTAVNEAAEINQLSHSNTFCDYTKYVGGIYSSEWFWAKIIHILRNDEAIKNAAFSWVEHCDWISALLTGNTNPLEVKRSRCASGHKAMWNDEFNGLPGEDFLTQLEPSLKGVRDNLYKDTYTNDVKIGNLSSEWADNLGLSESVSIGVGAFDAHMGAIGAEIKPGSLCKIIGTSTCDILVAPKEEIGDKLISGICGQVDGSVIPGMIGLEAGQSAFGDIYAWYKNLILWPVEDFINNGNLPESIDKEILKRNISSSLIERLSNEADKLPFDENGIVAIDWMNGRRTPCANQKLKGSISGLNLGSDAPRIFRALVESTAFGARKINEAFTSQGVKINEVIALGGVADKSSFVMQILADVLNMSIKVVKAEHACALGAAMCASVSSGIHPTIEDAQKAMGNGFKKEYHPRKEYAEKYNFIYEKYSKLGDFIENELT